MLRPLHEILIEKPLVLEANLSDLKLSKYKQERLAAVMGGWGIGLIYIHHMQ